MGYREAFLFDYDERFRVFGDQHVQYNLYEPSTQFAASLGNTFDIFILDPPRINRDVLVHVSAHVQWLARGPSPLVIAVTGAVMEDAVKELFNAKRTKWQPTHSCPLQNPFACFTNFESPRLQGWLD